MDSKNDIKANFMNRDQLTFDEALITVGCSGKY